MNTKNCKVTFKTQLIELYNFGSIIRVIMEHKLNIIWLNFWSLDMILVTKLCHPCRTNQFSRFSPIFYRERANGAITGPFLKLMSCSKSAGGSISKSVGKFS
jgi:hypothetical protein